MTTMMKALAQWTPATTAALQDYAAELGRASKRRAQSRQAARARMLRELHRHQDPLSWEIEQDNREGDTYW